MYQISLHPLVRKQKVYKDDDNDDDTNNTDDDIDDDDGKGARSTVQEREALLCGRAGCDRRFLMDSPSKIYEFI